MKLFVVFSLLLCYVGCECDLWEINSVNWMETMGFTDICNWRISTTNLTRTNCTKLATTLSLSSSSDSLTSQIYTSSASLNSGSSDTSSSKCDASCVGTYVGIFTGIGSLILAILAILKIKFGKGKLLPTIELSILEKDSPQTNS